MYKTRTLIHDSGVYYRFTSLKGPFMAGGGSRLLCSSDAAQTGCHSMRRLPDAAGGHAEVVSLLPSRKQLLTTAAWPPSAAAWSGAQPARGPPRASRKPV